MVCRMASSAMSFLALLLVAGCADPIKEAHTLAGTGQVDLAIQKLEELISNKPTNRQAYAVLGDIIMQSALSTSRPDQDSMRDAARAYEGALALSEEPEGLVLAKVALAASFFDQEKAEASAQSAWDCCREPAALPLLQERAAVVSALSTGEWKPAEWSLLPIFQQVPEAARPHVLVRSAGADILPLDGGDPVATLPPFEQISLDAVEDSRITFEDRLNPYYTQHSGWGKETGCSRGTWQCRGQWLSSQIIFAADKSLYNGPCWYMCARGSHAQALSGRGIRRGSTKCVSGTHSNWGSCQVSFERTHYHQRGVAREAVWLLPDGVDIGALRDALMLADEAGLDEARDRLGEGYLTTGLPMPLLDWLAGAAQPVYTITESAIEARFDATSWSYSSVNGVLAELVLPDQAAKGAPAPKE